MNGLCVNRQFPKFDKTDEFIVGSKVGKHERLVVNMNHRSIFGASYLALLLHIMLDPKVGTLWYRFSPRAHILLDVHLKITDVMLS